MRYRLALDLGTSSIGLVAYELDGETEALAIPYHAVRIFPEPLNPGQGVGEPKKAARRLARQQRRQHERKASRMKRIAHCLPLLGLDPEDIPPDPGQDIHKLRAEAATAPIGLADFARVLLIMAKRRGYAGGFRPGKEDTAEAAKPGKPRKTMPRQEDKKGKQGDETGIVKGGIDKLRLAMEACEADTLGQYLAVRHGKGQSLKLAPKDAEEKLYAHRDMLKAEFEQIWNIQALSHDVLNESKPDKHKAGEIRSVKDIFYDALFFQRPLKSPAAMVGKCPLEKDLPRAPAAQPAAQAFRIEKQLADLHWGMGKRAKPLTAEQKSIIRGLLRDKEKVSFSFIYTAPEKAGYPNPPGLRLNMDRASREELSGDKTRAVWRSKKFELLGDWDRLADITQLQIINFLADLGSPEQLYDPQWPGLFFSKAGIPRRFSEEFQGFINKLVQRKDYGRLSAMGFDGGRSSYSVKALEKLTGIMRDENLDEYAAIDKAYPDYHAPQALQTALPPPPVTGNTVVDVALHQVELEIRKAIKELGCLPEEVIVELARDMALGVSRRNEMEKDNTANRKRRENAAKELRRENLPDSKTNILKYLLWEEQDRYCPYCGHCIELTEVADGKATHFEHILPHSLTRVGRKRDQLVLAHNACNAAKADLTPWQAWGGEPPKNPTRWCAVVNQAQRFRERKPALPGKARLLELQDWQDDETVQGFSDRQFQETSWIAKLTAQWLRSICPPGKVQVSRGEMTAYLRRIWHLDTVIAQARFEEKPPLPVFDTEGQRVSHEDFDRHRAFWEGHDKSECSERTDRRIDKRKDHRHHLIDALVIGLSTPALYQRMAREYKARAERLRQGDRVKLTLSIEPPPSLRKRALDLVKHCNLSHKPDRFPDGALFKQTAYGVAEASYDGQTMRLRLKPEELRRDEAGSDNRRFLILREKLSGLAMDNNQKPLPLEKVRKALADIASPEMRRIVQEAFEQRIAEGKTPQLALSEAIIHPQYGTPIKAVKMKQGNADEAHLVIHESRGGLHYKLLPHEGYAYLEMSNEGKPCPAHPVEAMPQKGKKLPQGVLRFYKGDTVLDIRDGRHYLVRQIKAQSSGMLVLTPVTEAREVRDMNAAEGLRTVSGKALLQLKLV